MDTSEFIEPAGSAEGVEARTRRLRAQLARIAAAIAELETEVATTFEARALTSPHRSQELLAQAAAARRCAAQERLLARRYRREAPPAVHADEAQRPW